MLQPQLYSKDEYLKSKIQKEPCSKKCQPPLQCGICFWNAIQLPANRIPQCKACIADTKQYEDLLANKNEKSFKATCCKYCLWWDWFENKRNTAKSVSISADIYTVEE